MFKLILHHTYKLGGEAVDISHNDNHGFRTAAPFQPNGMAANSGALVFGGGPSRVRVTNKPVWQQMRALRIEAWVKLSALGQRRNIVEGDLSFAFFIHPDGVLWGTFFDPAHKTPPLPGTSASWPGVNSDAAAAPDGVRHTVPLNVWTKLTYLHDGVSAIRLYMNDALVGAYYGVRSGIQSLGATGVHIGHWPGDDRYTFSGEIDEVKIWKYDPDVPYKQFFCRPMSAQQMDCWRQVFDNMAEMLADPQQSKKLIGLMRCLNAATEDFVRAVRSKGEDAIKRQHNYLVRYRKLWCAGMLQSEDMERLMRNWLRWLVKLLGRPFFEAYRRRIQACWQEFGGEDTFGRLARRIHECDPEFAAYYELMFKIWGPALGV